MLSNPSSLQAHTDPLGLYMCAIRLTWMKATPAGIPFLWRTQRSSYFSRKNQALRNQVLGELTYIMKTYLTGLSKMNSGQIDNSKL